MPGQRKVQAGAAVWRLVEVVVFVESSAKEVSLPSVVNLFIHPLFFFCIVLSSTWICLRLPKQVEKVAGGQGDDVDKQGGRAGLLLQRGGHGQEGEKWRWPSLPLVMASIAWWVPEIFNHGFPFYLINLCIAHFHCF